MASLGAPEHSSKDEADRIIMPFNNPGMHRRVIATTTHDVRSAVRMPAKGARRRYTPRSIAMDELEVCDLTCEDSNKCATVGICEGRTPHNASMGQGSDIEFM
jgi:hypothetical protein